MPGLIDNMTVTASFGVTDYRGDEFIANFIKRARHPLHQEKHSG